MQTGPWKNLFNFILWAARGESIAYIVRLFLDVWIGMIGFKKKKKTWNDSLGWSGLTVLFSMLGDWGLEK